jgi:hypothetical protein
MLPAKKIILILLLIYRNAEIHRMLISMVDILSQVKINVKVVTRCVHGACVGYATEYPTAVSCDTLPPESEYSIMAYEDSSLIPTTPCKNSSGGIEWRIGFAKDDRQNYICNEDSSALVHKTTGEIIQTCIEGSACEELGEDSIVCQCG